jgi:cytochrome c
MKYLLWFALACSVYGADGKDLFARRCSGCHALDKEKEGPRLRGVYGRVSGSLQSFPYSDGLKKAAILWDDQSLERWLTNPEAVVPDTDMAFHVGDAAERKAIIEYLRSLGPTGR